MKETEQVKQKHLIIIIIIFMNKPINIEIVDQPQQILCAGAETIGMT